MRADNRSHLRAAAERRSQETTERPRLAVRRLDEAGAAITFAAVAQAAGVSRSRLYRQPDIRAEIDRLRGTPATRSPITTPAAQRASNQSLQRRVEDLLDANRSLRQEVQQLREHIAVLLGEQRHLDPVRPPITDHRPVGPCR